MWASSVHPKNATDSTFNRYIIYIHHCEKKIQYKITPAWPDLSALLSFS